MSLAAALARKRALKAADPRGSKRQKVANASVDTVPPAVVSAQQPAEASRARSGASQVAWNQRSAQNAQRLSGMRSAHGNGAKQQQQQGHTDPNSNRYGKPRNSQLQAASDGDSDGEDVLGAAVQPASAYDALLTSFKSAKAANGAAAKRSSGLSDSEGAESSSESESSNVGSSGEEDVGDEGVPVKAHANGASTVGRIGDTSKAVDEAAGTVRPKAVAHNRNRGCQTTRNIDSKGASSLQSAHSDDEDDKAAGSDAEGAAVTEGTAAAQRSTAGKAAADGDSSFQRHFYMELKEDAIAALGSAKPAFLEAEGAEQQGAWPNATWMITGSRLPKAPPRLADYGVKERLIARWHEVAQEDAASRAAAGAQPGTGQPVGDFVNAQQRALFSICSSYKDVFLPAREYPQSGDSPDALMDACLLHCLNHVTTAAGRIKKNNDRLKANPDDEVLRDQGFTRPKVLLLLPMRNSALRVVSRLVQLAQKETRADSVQNKQRFLEEFGAEEGDDEPEELDGKRRMQPKPADHKALFDGNCDDHFRMGVKITRGAVRLFSDFFQSDIIVASPLALATKINEASKEGAATVDFLSAIEIAVVERADVLQMQNWIHVKTVFDALNKVPEEQHGVDIMRVREWYLSGWGRFYRQTIVLSSFASAEMNALFNRTCVNHAGKARLRPVYKGVLGQTNAPLRQLFERFEPADAGSDADARFEYFKKTIWLRIRESGSTGQLIFVPSYFDFVRLRNFLKAEAAHFVGLCEYAKHSDVSRGRSHFFHGRRRIMLYTERAHFYNRYRIRGVKDVYFYQLPEHATAYAELLASLTDSAAASGDEFHQATVTALFSRFDTLQLERVVGSGRHRKMLKPGTSTFMFC